MKVTTPIRLDEETLKELDRVAGPGQTRSTVVETAIEELLIRRRRQAAEGADGQVLDQIADELNDETEDVLEFQAEV